MELKKTIVRKAEEEDPGFIQFWNIYPKRPGSNRKKAFKQWLARIKEGAFPQDILKGAWGYALYCKAEGKEPKYIMLAATFLGPDEHYLSDWSIKTSNRSALVERLRGGRDDGYTIEG